MRLFTLLETFLQDGTFLLHDGEVSDKDKVDITSFQECRSLWKKQVELVKKSCGRGAHWVYTQLIECS